MGLIGDKLPGPRAIRRGFAHPHGAARSAICARRAPWQSLPVRTGRLLSLAAFVRVGYPSPGRSDAPILVRPAEFFLSCPRNFARAVPLRKLPVVFGPAMPESFGNRCSKKGRSQCVDYQLGQFSAWRCSGFRPASTMIWNAALPVRPLARSSRTRPVATSPQVRSSAAPQAFLPTTSTPTSATDPRALGRMPITSHRRAGPLVRAAVLF